MLLPADPVPEEFAFFPGPRRQKYPDAQRTDPEAPGACAYVTAPGDSLILLF